VFDLRGLRLGVSSGSSSEGVGKILKGVFVELFRGVFVVVFAGVAAAAAPVSVDRLFLGDALVSSSYKRIIRKLRPLYGEYGTPYLWQIDLWLHLSIFIRLDLEDTAVAGPHTTLLLEHALCLRGDVIEKEIDKLWFFGGGREFDVMEQQNAAQVGYSQRRRIKVGLQVFVVHAGSGG
jgi:hypothetical protein